MRTVTAADIAPVTSIAGRIHVMTDRALHGLASIRPRSLAEAEDIPGIGVVKLHAVVPEFLESIAKWERNGAFRRELL